MLCNNRANYCAVNLIGSNAIHNLAGALLCSMLFYIAGTTAARATLPANPVYHQIVINEQFDVPDISFSAHWRQTMRHEAGRAMREHAPYLAIRLWKQLAEAGDRDAAYRLGLMYDTGDSQQRDTNLAVYWYRHAALAGEIHAQHNLGVAYVKGDGVAMDVNKAIKWWTLAARSGNADSQYNLGILYAAGEYGIKQDIEQAKHWWRKAAMRGIPMAQYNLGTLYVNNRVRDYCAASYWWKEAAKNGVERASLALRVIKTREGYHACQ